MQITHHTPCQALVNFYYMRAAPRLAFHEQFQRDSCSCHTASSDFGASLFSVLRFIFQSRPEAGAQRDDFSMKRAEFSPGSLEYPKQADINTEQTHSIHEII